MRCARRVRASRSRPMAPIRSRSRPSRGASTCIVSLAKVTVDAPEKAVADEPFDAKVTVSAIEQALPGGQLELSLPEGWLASPARHAVPGIAAGGSATYTFRVTPKAGADPFIRSGPC